MQSYFFFFAENMSSHQDQEESRQVFNYFLNTVRAAQRDHR
jgi:hypothetical protein